MNVERKYLIGIPNFNHTVFAPRKYIKKNGEISIYESTKEKERPEWDWYQMPLTVYEHRNYPNCTLCFRKYVPINKGDTECFKCNFTKK